MGDLIDALKQQIANISSHLIAGSDLESRHSGGSRHRYGRRIAMSFAGDILNLCPGIPGILGTVEEVPKDLSHYVFSLSCLCPSCLNQ